ncbi:hypothetical protein LCGC14_1852080 [marine sediment metagenome]|uniref:Uncharacterized protein n=1 Tax=marine sediment metagenome TaxID=412755 RepID=A0A0F9G9Z5_9ZZZZ
MSIELVLPEKASSAEEKMLNFVLAKTGGYVEGSRTPWFKMAWAATDFIRDKEHESCQGYPRCFHEKQSSYHILKYHPHACAFGGEYLCTGIHLLDVTGCEVHQFDSSAIPRQEQKCTCTPVHPTLTIAELIVPMIKQNQVTDAAAKLLAEDMVRAKYRKYEQEQTDAIFEPLRPTLSGRMPENDHPAILSLEE